MYSLTRGQEQGKEGQMKWNEIPAPLSLAHFGMRGMFPSAVFFGVSSVSGWRKIKMKREMVEMWDERCRNTHTQSPTNNTVIIYVHTYYTFGYHEQTSKFIGLPFKPVRLLVKDLKQFNGYAFWQFVFTKTVNTLLKSYQTTVYLLVLSAFNFSQRWYEKLVLFYFSPLDVIIIFLFFSLSSKINERRGEYVQYAMIITLRIYLFLYQTSKHDKRFFKRKKKENKLYFFHSFSFSGKVVVVMLLCSCSSCSLFHSPRFFLACLVYRVIKQSQTKSWV